MPELPDLEVYRENILRRLASKRLTGLDVYNPFKVQAPKGTKLDSWAGKELLRIDRSGKELFFVFEGRKVISAHLMLTGEMSILPQEAAEALKYKIFAMRFEQETLVFCDKGKLCTIKFMPKAKKAPDAFDESFTLQYFLNLAQSNPWTNVKAFLIDQSVVRGIGNAYADEILWAARISPHSLLGKIPQNRLEALYYAIGAVLRGAIDSLRAIVPDAISGEERSFLKVHNKDLKETETGHAIMVERIVDKTTYYTKEQIFY